MDQTGAAPSEARSSQPCGALVRTYGVFRLLCSSVNPPCKGNVLSLLFHLRPMGSVAEECKIHRVKRMWGTWGALGAARSPLF